jgi:hypothetical protein
MESCSLFHNLQIHILFEIFKDREGPVMIKSICCYWKFFE